MGRLEGKVAIVTGAGCVGSGWGNGRAMAVRFVEEGARVLAADRDPARLAETLERAGQTIRAAGGAVGGAVGGVAGGADSSAGNARGGASAAVMVAHECDATDSDSVKAMIEAAIKQFGRIDIMINNVGGSAAGGPVEMSEEVWDAQIDFNLKSVFLGCKHVLPVMEAQGSGVIINVASTSGLRWTGAAQVAYAATKAAVMQLTKVVAVQYAPKGIRVNCVVPGQLHTPMVEMRLAKQRAGGDVEALLASRRKRIPLGFMGDGRDTANAALFLASDEAKFITGTDIIVDGGMTARCD